jgi:hypothetical protein
VSPPDDRSLFRARLVAVAFAVLFAAFWHAWVGDAHLNAAEEGYLWYGSWRAGLGDVPLRDFQSYDPGRYYFCAALGKVFGSGVLGLRRSIAVAQGLGLLFGLLAARRATRNPLALACVGLVLGAWLFPRHKVFEGTLALAATWAGVCLLEKPDARRHLLAGTVAGLIAFFGRNLGAYAAVGAFVLFALSAWKRRAAGGGRNFGALAGGVVLGYLPMLAMFVLVPGFWAGFVRSMLLLLRLGTNIESPWLFPWRLELEGLNVRAAAGEVALAGAFLVPLVVLPLGAWLFLRARAEELPRRALVFAATVLGALWLHHASVRSDSSHFAQSIQPTWLAGAGLLLWLSERRRAAALAVALVAVPTVLLAALENNPQLNHVGRVELVEARLGADTLRMLPAQADYFARLQAAVGEKVGAEERLFIAPSRPSFYPLFGKRSPSWWIYFFVKDADEAEQAELLAELAEVEWVLIVDQAIAEREELRFRNSYPLVWRTLETSYRRVPTPTLEPNHLLLRRREGQ